MLGLANFIRRGIKAKSIKKGPKKESPLELERKFRDTYIAERPVDLQAIEEFRGDAFPISGPVCWLDRPNALLEVERRHTASELSDAEAAI